MRKIIVELYYDEDPLEVDSANNKFETHFTHPSLSGELILTHGADASMLMNAIKVDMTRVDPTSVLVDGILKLVKEHSS